MTEKRRKKWLCCCLAEPNGGTQFCDAVKRIGAVEFGVRTYCAAPNAISATATAQITVYAPALSDDAALRP